VRASERDDAPPSSDTGYYDRRYGGAEDPAAGDLEARIRRGAFGEDIGQFSWTTADEHRRFQAELGLHAGTMVLDVACGYGGPSLFMARSTGCSVIGVGVHEAGVAAANEAAHRAGLGDRASFLVHDVRDPLPFADGTFEATISIDSINHVFDRRPVFAEWYRVLKPGGRVLYTDAVVVTGPLRREEIVSRSGSMGEFVFTPEGADEPLLREAGFAGVRFEDVTANIVAVAGRWKATRAALAGELDRTEGPEANAAFQTFLTTVHRLASERRLSRFAFHAYRKG
jgi:SAM-dependent methyltransferase